MVSVFPPMYGLTPVFNIPDSAIVEIIKTGYSEIFWLKAKKLLDKYNNSVGIDEHKLPFIKLLSKRVNEIKKTKDREIYFDDELIKVLNFLEDVVNQKEEYFLKHIKKGRELKSLKYKSYSSHKMKSITYTPFGVFKSRENKSFIKSSGSLFFDIDIKLNKKEIKKIVQFFLENKYIKASWVSFSGSGFGFTVKAKWSNEMEMKKVYYKLLEKFHFELINKYDLHKRVFDTQVCSLSRMNVISYGLISNNNSSKVFEINDYSDGLYNMLHTFYKKDSMRNLPNKILTEQDYIKAKTLFENNLKNKTKQFFDESKHDNFLEKVTKSMMFNGSDDYNGTIKNFVAKIFRYKVDEGLIEDFLFSKIPRTNGSESNYKRLWSCFSGYSSFRSVEPFYFK